MKNKIIEIKKVLENINQMSLEEIEATKKYFSADIKIMNKVKQETAKKEREQKEKEIREKEKAAEKKYKNITSFRYGAMNLYAELGIEHEKEYTKTDLIKILNDRGYFEFSGKDTDFAQHEQDGTVVITIRGNSKGARFFLALSPQILSVIEKRFQEVYKTDKTEARALVYHNEESNDFYIVYPDQTNTTVSTTSDIELNIHKDDKIYYLAFDFHSHHVMGAYFSRIDDDNERFRNICYGVFSWYGQLPTWKFRTWNGRAFTELRKHEVIY